MTEPTIVCPNCRVEIKLTESLAAPLVESIRCTYEERLRQKDADAAAREKAIRQREEAVRRTQETLDQQLADKLRVEKARIAAEEARKAKVALSAEMDQKAAENAALHKTLGEYSAKLAEAQKAQVALLVKERELEDARREMALTIQKHVQAELAAVRQKARTEADEAAQLRLAERDLKLAEKDQTIAAMKKQLEDAQRKAEQGSQQLQGEALELQLETVLRERFVHDAIEAVPKGEHGGDILQRVATPGGLSCGTILWETKRTKNWSDGWLAKLREDQRAAKAEIAVILSVALPRGVESFEQIEGIWVADPRYAVPLAAVLRMSLLEVSSARQSATGQQTKAELVYQYLTGPRFKLRVQAIVEAFSGMHDDLQKEKKAIMKQWAKRETEIARVLEATVGLYGDLQGIAGRNLQEIEGLEMRMLEGESEATHQS